MTASRPVLFQCLDVLLCYSCVSVLFYRPSGILFERDFKAFHCCLQIRFLEHVGYADLVLAHSRCSIEACRGSDHYGLAFITEILEQPLCETFAVVYRQAGDCVERSHRHRAVYAFHFVKGFYQYVPSPYIFVLYFPEILFGCIQSPFRSYLAEGRGAEPCLGVSQCRRHDFPVFADDGSDAHSAEAVSLGNRVHEYDIVLHAFEIHA